MNNDNHNRQSVIPRSSRRFGLASSLLLALSISPTLSAQSDSGLLAELKACLEIEWDPSRLECLENVIAAQPASGSNAGSRASVTPAPAPPPARTAAVAPRPQARPQPEPEPEPEPAEVRVTIVDLRTFQPGEAMFTTDDGRIFDQTSGRARRGYPEPPFEAVLQSGALGSLFLLAPDTGSRVRVRERR